MDKPRGNRQYMRRMKLLISSRRGFGLGLVAVLLTGLVLSSCRSTSESSTKSSSEFAFLAAGDMRQFVESKSPNERYFDGLCEEAKRIGGDEGRGISLAMTGSVVRDFSLCNSFCLLASAWRAAP